MIATNRLTLLVLLLFLAWAPQSRADVVADWGTVATPITEPVTFSFAQYDITRNFTDQYSFSLEGSADATYFVSFSFDPCRNGCGNPAMSYGVYDANGGLIDPSADGTYLLTAGDYSFQVKGTGFGSGTSVDYRGSVTFAATAVQSVAAVPEPESVLLIALGLATALAWRARKYGLPMLGSAAALVALQGCSEATGNVPTQVVARVNGSEISVHQLNSALKRVPGSAASEIRRKEALDKLVDRELAVAKALEQKLDRTPDVLERIEATRQEILASAYAERIAAQQPPASDKAIEQYYQKNPALFAERAVYRLREVSIPADAPDLAGLKYKLASAQLLPEILDFLRSRQVKLGDQTVIRAAEQVALEALPRLAATREGQYALFETPNGILVMQVLGRQNAPLDYATAKPIIVDHLARISGRQAMQAELARLRSQAQIEMIAAAKPLATAAR